MTFLPFFWVLAATAIGILSAILLKFTATLPAESILLAVMLFCLVLFCNFLRMLIWGVVYKRYRVSHVYPLGSIFFPLILCVSHYYYGEEITLNKIIGVLLIVAGIAVVMKSEGKSDEKN